MNMHVFVCMYLSLSQGFDLMQWWGLFGGKNRDKLKPLKKE